MDLSDLLINIWSYVEHVYHKASPDPSSCVCEKYLQFCIVAAKKKKKKWSDEYLDFDIVVRHLKGRNRWFGEFDKIPTEKKNKIFDIIKKDYI